ncbi:MAG: hypothetical protein IJ658_03305, partial [Kiritimatiellae bacterium]|nr:hypothetical protein [Kiritimatiellia bacterium]
QKKLVGKDIISFSGKPIPCMIWIVRVLGFNGVNHTNLARIISLFKGKNGFGMLLATVAEKFFRELIVYRDALDNGWLTPYGTWARDPSPQIAEDLNAADVGPAAGKAPWLVKRGAANARQFTLRELRLARYRMLQVRERLVSSSSDDSIVASELLRIIARPPARPVRK